jgi:glucose/arabinose dehydrogenase
VTVGLEVVGSGFESPLLVTGAGDGSGRLFVVEQGGVVWFVRDGERSDEAFLDISSMVSSGGEQGLLGMAFHPEFPADPRFFVNYTDVEGDTVIAEYAVDPADPDRADPSTARTLLTVDQPFANHNGGATVFGPDGYLYLGLGDGGSAGDPLESGQSLDTLLGKVLRIDVDAGSGGEPYAIPPDNPFVDRRNALPEIWHYGLRNPWRFSFDPATDDLWIGDVGQNIFEEVDVARSNEGGLNFGWNTMEGPECYDPFLDCDRTGLTLPVAAYEHQEDRCTIVGGHVYRGDAQPALRGGYVFADYCSGEVFLLDAQQPGEIVLALDAEGLLSSFGVDDEGELYVTDLGGDVMRVTGSS